MLIIYTEDMHDFFLMTIIQILRVSYHEEILLIIPPNKLHRIGIEYFKGNRIKLIKSWDTLKRDDYLTSSPLSISFYYLKLIYRLFFKSFSVLTSQLEGATKGHDRIAFLALEAYPPIGNRFVRKIVKRFDFSRTSIVLHDALGYHSSIKKYLLKWNIKSVFLYITSRISYKSEIALFNNLIVLDYKLVEVTKNFHKKNTLYLPFILPTLTNLKMRGFFLESNSSSNLIFVVPGNVDSKRRDYYSIINSFKKFNSELYQLVFLGKVVESDLIEYALDHRINLKYFEGYLSRSEFEKELLKSHFVIYAPSETFGYGKTKISGIPLDAMSFGIPLINLSQEEFPNQLDIKVDELSFFLDKVFLTSANYLREFGEPALKKVQEFKIDKFSNTINQLI